MKLQTTLLLCIVAVAAQFYHGQITPTDLQFVQCGNGRYCYDRTGGYWTGQRFIVHYYGLKYASPTDNGLNWLKRHL